MAARKREPLAEEAIPENDANVATEMVDYNFDASFVEDFGDERRGKAGKRTDEELGWYATLDPSTEGEKYEDVFYEEDEEVGEGEEEIPLSPMVSAEKLEEARQVEESDHVLVEIPTEVTAEREAIINRLKELQSELIDLRQRNKLLELWVTRWMKKTQQRMVPADIVQDHDLAEQKYKEALHAYKMRVDEILTQQFELTYELQNYTQKVRRAREECARLHSEFLERQKEMALGLVYEKSGRKITEKIMNVLTRRQMTRTKVLVRDRRRYILLRHLLEDLIARLKTVETLGEGMTTMDFEVLRVVNIGYKDRLDERDKELENLRVRIAETVNGVAHYKEKEVCIVEDIDDEERRLKDYREANTRARERVNRLRSTLNEIRDRFNEKKIEAGLLMARQELREMERKTKLRDDLKKAIVEFEREITLYEPKKRAPKRKTTTTIRDTSRD